MLVYATVLYSLISSSSGQLFRPCGCEKTFEPVCGTDGVTYDNPCFLHCKSSNDTKLAYKGPCCPRNLCPTHRSPICDNYGRTYVNECVFFRMQCLLRKTSGRVLLKSHDGECLEKEVQQEDCDAGCLFSNDTAVCDENGATHENECIFEKMNCNLRNKRKPEVLLRHYGECNQPNETFTMGTTNVNSTADVPDIEGSGMEMKKQPSVDSTTAPRSTSRGDVKSSPLIENFPRLPDLQDDELIVPQNQLQKAIRARAVPSVFLDDIDTLIASEQAALALRKDEISSPSQFKSAAVEASRPMVQTIDGHAALPANLLLPMTVISNGTLQSTEELLGGKSIPPTPAPRTVSVSAILQPFDMTQPCSAADCDKTKNPVCDSNNRTHKNMCLFKFFACKVHRHDGRIVELAYVGECKAGVNLVEMNCPPCPLSPSDVTICDNQNMTHRSLCELARFNCQQRMRYESERVLVHIGQCHSRSLTFSLKDEQCPKYCSEERKPVCDAQGNTHKNLCHFQQSSCLIRKEGRPAPTLLMLKPCSDATRSFPKVIPSNSISPHKVNSSSTLETASATSTAYECPPPACTLKGQPVCDTQGVLHENICLFVHARCLAARSGVTLSAQNEENCLRTKCQEECSSNEKPVCGSNFVTYKNLCYFNKERCKDESLSVLFYGRCEECLAKPCPPVPQDATDDHFVCDEDGFTRTVCEFQMLSCILERSISANMSIQHLGKCCEPDLSCNVGIWPPVCGTDGRTYANKCALSVEDCRNSKLQLPAIKVAHLGACEEAEADVPLVVVSGEFGDMIGSSEGSTEAVTTTAAGEKYSEGIANCPNSCDNIYNPVCGSDDITYTNMCHLKLAQCLQSTMMGLAYRGECCSMDCPNNFSPVCDDQGVTHQNLCFFGRERCIVERITGKNITIQKFDVCDDNACDKECPATYKPVCASNGETMVNECHLEKLKCFMAKKFSSGRLVKKLHDGECCPNENCGYDFSPVCDSQGHTHANPCVFRQAACLQRKTNNVTITVQYNGQCCNRQCEGQHVPICAGNRTYHNLCEFKVAQCEAERHGQVLAISYPGECCLMPKGNCETSGVVCDSDGQTHRDMCHFLQKKCVTNRTMRKALSVIHTGECCTIEACHKDGSTPVCDTRGGTHATKCHFQNTKCIHDKIHPNSPINLDYNGACCANNCEGIPDELVCDQHGNMYRNRCHFKFKACERRRRINSILLETPCPERRLVRSSMKTVA
uniref:Serine protease inhibitor n=1 Tax=Haemonchus contortus TaxID=6289 RepID=A0A7I4Z639_HAECO